MVIRRMRDEPADYERMVAWRNRPHVRMWWDPDDPPLDLPGAIQAYRPDTIPDAATTACIVEVNGSVAGYLQFYRWNDYDSGAKEMGFTPGPNWWGLDIFIGEPELIGRGYGARAVRLLSDFLCNSRGASAVALTTDMTNDRAIRAYEMSGFVKQFEVLDTDTRGGARVRAWLMLKLCS
jgi:aminoglycoside 6'-N-acetyltransferase